MRSFLTALVHGIDLALQAFGQLVSTGEIWNSRAIELEESNEPPEYYSPGLEKTFSIEELSLFNGKRCPSNPSAIVYLSVGGIVFDVTAGFHFYGEGHEYNCFAGRAVSRFGYSFLRSNYFFV